VQRAEGAVGALPVEATRDRGGVGVDFDHCIERGARVVERGDPAQKHYSHVLGGHATRRELRAQRQRVPAYDLRVARRCRPRREGGHTPATEESSSPHAPMVVKGGREKRA
jgi:hypothetical protein